MLQPFFTLWAKCHSAHKVGFSTPMKKKVERDFEPPLDPGIVDAVRILRAASIETFESCEGGPGHSYPEPAVRFNGERAEGFRALAVAIQEGLQVAELRRVWRLEDGDPTGPWWELTFRAAKAR